jgi:hypothetical protein
MPLTASVVPGEQFPDNTTITRARLRNAANPAVTLGGQLSNGDVAADAGIALTQLDGIGQGKILVGGSTANGSSENNIEAVALSSGGIASNKLTPSEGTVGYAELEAGTNSIIDGATDYGTGVVAKSDKVIFSDTSDGVIKKTTVENFLKSTFSTQVAYTDLGGGTPMVATGTMTVDFDGNPVQVIALNPPTTGTTYTLTVTYENGPDSGFAKNVMLVISNNTPSTTVKLAFSAPNQGNFWFLNSNPPASIAGDKLGVLAMTGWPGDKCIAGWAVEP